MLNLKLINSPQAKERLNICVRATNIQGVHELRQHPVLSGVLFKIFEEISSMPVLF